MADNISPEQLRQLQATVEQLSRRVAALESRRTVAAPVPPAATGKPAPTPAHRSSSVGLRVFLAVLGVIGVLLGALVPLVGVLGLGCIIFAIFWPAAKSTTVVSPTPVAHTAVRPIVRPQPRQPSQFEQDLGKHWFSWLGIISLVVGITLLLGYALRDYGLLGRVVTGYAAAVMLFGITAWFWKAYRGFAMILESGAWAIVYLSTYALHASEGQIITSPVTGGLLLMGVVVIIAIAAWMQKSRALTAGAFLLGYIAALTNTVDLFTLWAMLFLSIGLVGIASYRRWPDFILVGTIATYVVQFAWMVGLGNNLNVSITTGATFLIAEVLIFGLAHWLTAVGKRSHEQLVVGGTVANLLGFFWLLQYLISATHSANGWMATLFMAIICGLLAGLTYLIPSRHHLRTVYMVFAISFLTIGLAQHWHGDGLATGWLLETGALLAIGTSSKIRSIRYMGYMVGLLTIASVAMVMTDASTLYGTTPWHSRLVLGLLASVVFGSAAALCRVERDRLPVEEIRVPAILADVAVGFLLLVVAAELPVAWVPVVWSVIATIAIVLGTRWQSLNGRIVGYVVLVLSVLSWLSSVATTVDLAGPLNVHSRLIAGLWIVMMAGLSAWFIKRQNMPRTEEAAHQALWWLATITMTFVLGFEVAKNFISIAWGLEGIALYLIGFAEQSATARRQGLVVMGLTIAKVYVYDVQTLSTPNRILSFIILGILLLVIGYLYNRWRQKSKTGS